MSTPTRKEQRDAAREERKAQEAALARASARKKRLTILGAIVALAAALVIALVAVSAPDDEPETVAGDAVAGQSQTAELLAGIPQDGRFLGSPDAPVTLVEFADVQCPFCKEYTDNALPTVIRDYVRTGKVRLEFRPRAFLGEDSVEGAQLVAAAGRRDKLWNVLELLYANQGAENSGWLSEELGTKVLTAAGLDPARTRTQATSAAVQEDLKAADLLATRNGLDGTPAFLVGKTGGALAPLQVQAITGAFFAQALDQAAA